MNAYELTKELNKFMTEDEYTDLDKAIFMASNMLRQQADRIDKLEREAIAKNNYLEQHCQKIDQQADRIAELEKKELNAGGEPVKNATYWKRQHDKLADRIAELEKENSNLKYEISSGAWQPKEATDQELFNIYAHLQDTYKGNNFPVALGRKILKLYTTPQTKPLSDEEIQKVINQIDWNTSNVLIRFARAIEERHGIK